MAAIRDTKVRDHQREMEGKFPNSEKVTASPLKYSADGYIGAVRSGEIAADSVPWMLPYNKQEIDESRQEFLEGRFNRRDAGDLAAYRKLIKDAGQAMADQDNANPAIRELAEYRTFEITNDVLATPWSLSAFMTIDLSPDELPLIERPRGFNLQQFTVRSTALDGSTVRGQWRTTKSVEGIEMEYISTDRIEYQLIDLQQGDVSQVDDVNTRLQYDLEMHIDGLAKDNIDAAKMTSGLRDLLSLHPKIDVDNLPDTNYLDLNALHPGNDNVLTIAKLKTILDHVSKFGSAGGADQPISISTIFISPQNIRDPWDFVDLVSGFSGGNPQPKDTVLTSVREQIFNTGMITNAWGHTFSWTPNAQLAKGKMYVLTSQPLGWQFTKTVFDKMLKWDESVSPTHADRNIGEVLFKKAMKFYVPDVWRHRVVIIDL